MNSPVWLLATLLDNTVLGDVRSKLDFREG